MYKFIWEKANLLVLDGKKVLFKYLIHTSLNQLFTTTSNTISDLLMLGFQANVNHTAINTNGWMKEPMSGSAKNLVYLQIPV
jgi:hypothetical protein